MQILFNKIILKFLGILSVILGCSMMICSFYGMSIEEWAASKALMSVGLTLSCIGSLIILLLRSKKISLKPRAGYIISCTTWIFCSLIGAVPFIIYGYPVASSVFESVAGFTTTGCTVFDLTTMPNSLVMWRAMSNWLGGIGVLVLVITLFSSLGINAKSIVGSESSASTYENLGNSILLSCGVLLRRSQGGR